MNINSGRQVFKPNDFCISQCVHAYLPQVLAEFFIFLLKSGEVEAVSNHKWGN